METSSAIERHQLIPVIRARTESQAMAAAKALYQGGLRLFEITFTVPDAAKAISTLRSEMPADAVIGAGTVTTLAEANEALASGAQFLVSPGYVSGLVALAHAGTSSSECRAAAVMLGALTPSEILRARDEGADFIKLFPASALGGPAYLRALAGPFPALSFVPTGGVTLDNVGDYLSAGAKAVGVGGALVDIFRLERDGPEPLISEAKRYVAALSGVTRSPLGS